MQNAIINSICCDIILQIKKPDRLIKLITTASKSPKWLRHKFIIILDDLASHDEQKFKDWYYEAKVNATIPEIVIMKSSRSTRNNRAAIFNQAIQASDNPFIYFQNEKDPLPVNLDRVIMHLYYNRSTDVAFAQCETFIENGSLIEIFPGTNLKNEFLHNNEEACKMFPSYAHPLSAVYRRKLFENVPFWDPEKSLGMFAYYYFALRVLNNPKVNVEYLPFTLKISIRTKTSSIVISDTIKHNLIKDFKILLPEFEDTPYKEFQLDILEMLENGSITTFKEIDARIEDNLEKLGL